MSKKSTLPQRARHILVYDEDWEFLNAMFGPGSVQPVGPGAACRTIIHGTVGRMRQRAIDAQDRSAGQGAPADLMNGLEP